MQNVLWMVLELAANLYESFVCIHFIICSFDKKCKTFNVKMTYLIGTVIMMAVVTILNSVTEYEGLLGLIYTVYHILFSVFFLRGTFLKKVFISVLTNICLISTAAISGNVLFSVFKDNPMKIYAEHTLERFIFMIIGLALLTYVLTFFSRFTKGGRDSLKPKEWLLILSVLGISFLIIVALHVIILSVETADEHISLLMASEIGIIFINILCLYITVNLNETRKREEQLIIDKRRSENSQQYAQTVMEQYDQTRRLRHDMKQYSSALRALIKDGKSDLAEAFVEKQTESLFKIETVINVDNDFLNAILNSKLSFAKSKGIDVLCSIENDISGIEDIDLCNLIGNLLDNAISAAEKCDPDLRLIEVKISSAGSRLVIVVKNSILASVLKENPDLNSTKQDPSEHGFGVKTIKYIAEKYNGTFDFFEEGLVFVGRVELHRA